MPKTPTLQYVILNSPQICIAKPDKIMLYQYFTMFVFACQFILPTSQKVSSPSSPNQPCTKQELTFQTPAKPAPSAPICR